VVHAWALLPATKTSSVLPRLTAAGAVPGCAVDPQLMGAHWVAWFEAGFGSELEPEIQETAFSPYPVDHTAPSFPTTTICCRELSVKTPIVASLGAVLPELMELHSVFWLEAG
jgi:hypothetical protein